MVQQRTPIGVNAFTKNPPQLLPFYFTIYIYIIIYLYFTFLDCTDFLNILLELHADLADHTTILLTHFSSQERAFRSQGLTGGWHGVASRELGLSCQFGGYI